MKVARVFLTALFVIAGCTVAPKPQQQVDIPTATFDWTPPTAAAINSAGINFGVVAGSYGRSEDLMKGYPFDRFASNMGKDFVELLTARGFTTTGPYETLNDMTYGEKKACDLIIVPELDIDPVLEVDPAEKHPQLFGSDYYTFNGTFIMRGRVSLTVQEALSGTKMWTKSVEIPETKSLFKGQRHYETPNTLVGRELVSSFQASDPGLTSVMAAPLEQAYADILQKAWAYLEPEEMAQVKAQAQEVRGKTTFQGN